MKQTLPFPLTQRDAMVWIPGGDFMMGSDRHYREEAPTHRVSVSGFWIDPTPVTNAQFARFVQDTGHVTVAERPPNAAEYSGAKKELLSPASIVFVQPRHRVDMQDPDNWWSYVQG